MKLAGKASTSGFFTTGQRALRCYYRLGLPQSRSRCDRKEKELLTLPGIETKLLIKYKHKYTNLLLSLKDQATNECVYESRGKDLGTCWHYMGVRRYIHAVPHAATERASESVYTRCCTENSVSVIEP